MVGIHFCLASVTSTPELAIDSTEAQNLAEAIRGVADQYTMSIDPRTVAWGNLLLVAGMVYGPRIITIKNNAKAKPAELKAIPIREATPPAGKTAPKVQTTNGHGQMSPSQMYSAEDLLNFGHTTE